MSQEYTQIQEPNKRRFAFEAVWAQVLGPLRRVFSLFFVSLIVVPLFMILLVPALTPQGWVQRWLEGMFDITSSVTVLRRCSVEGEGDNVEVKKLGERVGRTGWRWETIDVTISQLPRIEAMISKIGSEKATIRRAVVELEKSEPNKEVSIRNGTSETVARRIERFEDCYQDLDARLIPLKEAGAILLPLKESLRDLALALRTFALGSVGALIGIFVLTSTPLVSETQTTRTLSSSALNRATRH